MEEEIKKRGPGRPKKEDYERRDRQILIKTSRLYATKFEYICAREDLSKNKMFEKMVDKILGEDVQNV